MKRRYTYFTVVLGLASLLIGAFARHSPLRAESLVFYAVTSGQQALDSGESGGNPFASALIEVLRRPTTTLSELPTELERLTAEKSQSRMAADVPHLGAQMPWPLTPARPGERRIALVLVVSDYSRSGGAPSLPGARHDAQRITAALQDAGFETETALDLDAMAMRQSLDSFLARSETADAAIIYTTGHGAEVDGEVYLLPADFPLPDGRGALENRAVTLADIARSIRARHVNLVFYGGCRDNPFEP